MQLMKPKILQLINSFHTGGSERQAVQLTGILHEEKSCQVSVACLNKEGVLREVVENFGITDIPEFPLVSFYDANFLRQIHRFANLLRERKIQIIQSSDFYTNVFGMAAGKLAQVPVRIAAKRETGMKTKAQKFIERRAFNFSHAIVANAEAVKKSLVETGVPSRKIEIIYNGLDLKKFPAPPVNRRKILRGFDLPDDENLRFVVIVANFRSAVKNQKMFLRAAKKVQVKVPDARFVLAGEGEFLNETKDFARALKLENATFFTGRCADVSALVSIADVCVLSSVSEGFSNSILEYMAAGKPVVATNVGGAAEAIVEGQTGFLTASDDDGKMAQRLIEILLDSEKARELGAAGRKRIEENFSIAAQLEKMLALYRKLLAAKQKTK